MSYFPVKTLQSFAGVGDLMQMTPPMGLILGGEVEIGTGLTLLVKAGEGYLRDGAGTIAKVSWGEQTLTVQPNLSEWVFVDEFGIIHSTVNQPENTNTVTLGRYLSNETQVVAAGDLALRIPTFNNALDRLLRFAVGPIFVSGCVVSKHETMPRAFNVSSGHYFYSSQERKPDSRSAPPFVYGYRLNGSPRMIGAIQVPNNVYDTGAQLGTVSTGHYTKHVLYTNGDGNKVQFILSLCQNQYTTLQEALDAPVPIPIISPENSPQIAVFIMQEGNNQIVEIQDARPRLGFSATASTSSSNHGDLLGLDSDHHHQYLLANGTRPMLGNLNMGNFAINGVGSVNGVQVTSHAARHLPNGADPLACGPAVGLNTSSLNTSGSANSFAKSDHTHQITGFQPESIELSAVSGLSSTGFAARTGAGAWVARTLATGSASRLTLTNANGATGNPTLDLAPVTDTGAGSFSKLTRDAYGRVTGTSAVTTGDLTPLLTGLYLNASTTPADIGAQVANADLTAVAGLSSTGFAARTGDSTWAQRSIASANSSRLTVANGDGVAGNPSVDLAIVADSGTGAFLKVSRDAYGRVTGTTTVTNADVTDKITTGAGLTVSGSAIALATLTDAGTGTFSKLSRDAYGRVSGTTAVTSSDISGLLDADLNAIAAINTTGVAVRTGVDTWATRSLTAGSSKITVSNGSGAAGNPTIDVSEPNLNLNNISGVLITTKGGTGLNAIGASNTFLGVKPDGTGLEYKSLVAGTGIAITHGTANTVALAPITTERTYSNAAIDVYGRVIGGTYQTTGRHVNQIFTSSFGTIVTNAYIAHNNTAPTVSEGVQIASITVTPFNTSSTMSGVIRFTAACSDDSDRAYTVTVFRGSTLVGMTTILSSTRGFASNCNVSFSDVPGTTSAVTYTVRIGYSQTGTTVYINRNQFSTFGNAGTGSITVHELI